MNTKKRNRLKKWSLPFIILVLFILLIIGGSISWIYFNKDKVGNIIVNELNKSLKTEITVENIDMVFISTFPFVSLEFKNVLGKEILPEGENPDTLFHAGFVYLKFNLIDIYKRKYSIKRIRIEDASFRMRVFKDGSNNYIFWKTSEEGSAILLDLEKIDILNSHFSYQDFGSKQFYDLQINKSISSGEFNSGWNQIKTKTDLFINVIQFDKVAFARNTPARIEMIFLHDGNKNEISVSDNKLLLRNLPFTVNGSYNYSNNQYIDVSIKSKRINIKELLTLLPEQYKKDINSFKSNGVIDINAVIKGAIEKNKRPNIAADFVINNGSLGSNKNSIFIKDIKLSGNFTNGNKQNLATSKIQINNLSANVNEGFVNGNFSVTNFNRPIIDGNIKADFDIQILTKLFPIENIEKASGNLKADLILTGKINDLSKGQAYALEQCKINGEAFLSNGNIKLKSVKNEIKDINTNILFSNNQIDINYLTAALSNTDISFSGTAKNLLSYLFAENDLSISGNMIVNHINLEDFFSSSTEKDSSTVFSISLPKRISSDLLLSVSSFEYKTLKSRNLKSRLILKNNSLSLENINIATWGGNISGNLHIMQSPENMHIQGEAKIKQIEAEHLLYTFNNFGQKLFTSENLKGKVSSDVQFSFSIHPKSGFDLSSLKTIVDLKIENGELINVEPLMKLSSFLDENSLKHIKFKTLTNTLIIKNKTLEVPEMEVSSNAVNFFLNGKHTFENVIDYHIKLYLSELAGKRQKERLKKEQENFGAFEEDNSGKITLHLAISGTIDNPKFKYDLPSAKAKVKEDIQKEKKEIQESFKNEFTSPEQEKIKENWKEQEKGNYIIEWGEDTIKQSKPQKKKETQFIIEWGE